MARLKHTHEEKPRDGSTVREILKRRDRPYKTETTKVLERKKKDVHTSFRQAPPGYTFLPVGTPDLAARCKELTQQRRLKVYVVSTKSHSKQVEDRTKVSHHVARIGYHFDATVVGEACEQLGYVMQEDKFIKEADLQAQHEQSRIAQTMARHGLYLENAETSETPAQVRGALRELFPKMPEEDLHEIVAHAWKPGSHRVGTSKDVPLSRRVQLATLARIRHKYTDYDALLRAFGNWRDARDTVEPICLHKIIEWRGENDMEEDQELHEIVRDTIVIPDDESATEPESMSDSNVQVTQLPAGEDLGAESVGEGVRRRNHRRHARPPREMDDWNNIARRKIGVARQRIRDGLPPCVYELPPGNRKALTEARIAIPISVEADERGHLPNVVVVDGQAYERAVPGHGRAQQAHSQTQPARLPDVSTFAQPSQIAMEQLRQDVPANMCRSTYTAQDQPIVSIERDDGYIPRQSGTLVPHLQSDHRPVNPQSPETGSHRFETRHRSDHNLYQAQGSRSMIPALPHQQSAINGVTRNSFRTSPGKFIDLSSLEDSSKIYQTPNPTTTPASGRHVQSISQTSLPTHSSHYQPTEFSHSGGSQYGLDYSQRANEHVTYQPTEPPIQQSSIMQYQPISQGKMFSSRSLGPSQAQAGFYRAPYRNEAHTNDINQITYPAGQQQQVIYLSEAAHATPPIHGAPAPIQQVSRPAPRADHYSTHASNLYHPRTHSITAASPAPTNGAPHPAQFYHQR